eukprot:221303_1
MAAMNTKLIIALLCVVSMMKCELQDSFGGLNDIGNDETNPLFQLLPNENTADSETTTTDDDLDDQMKSFFAALEQQSNSDLQDTDSISYSPINTLQLQNGDISTFNPQLQSIPLQTPSSIGSIGSVNTKDELLRLLQSLGQQIQDNNRNIYSMSTQMNDIIIKMNSLSQTLQQYQSELNSLKRESYAKQPLNPIYTGEVPSVINDKLDHLEQLLTNTNQKQLENTTKIVADHPSQTATRNRTDDMKKVLSRLASLENAFAGMNYRLKAIEDESMTHEPRVDKTVRSRVMTNTSTMPISVDDNNSSSQLINLKQPINDSETKMAKSNQFKHPFSVDSFLQQFLT